MLTIVSTPIGNVKDVTLRALDTLKKVDIVICEERRVGETMLKRMGIEDKILHELNEHSSPKDIQDLLLLVRSKKCALISDCGTPGFFDPGPELVAKCIKENIALDINPGASSLMALIPLLGFPVGTFQFQGFLPAENREREQALFRLKSINQDFFLMDTPYRLKKTIDELAQIFPDRQAVLGLDLTGKDHLVLRGTLSQIREKSLGKSPFVLFVKY